MRKIHYVDLLVCPRISTGFWFLNFWTKPCCAKGRRQRPFLLPAEWLRAIPCGGGCSVVQNLAGKPSSLVVDWGFPSSSHDFKDERSWWPVFGEQNFKTCCLIRRHSWRVKVSKKHAFVLRLKAYSNFQPFSTRHSFYMSHGQDHLRHLKNRSGLAWWTIPQFYQ